MSVLFDVLLALILAVCAFIGYKHGLVRALSKFLSYLIAFTLANKFYYLLADLFARISLFEEMLAGSTPYAEKMTFLDRLSFSFDLIKENAVVIGAGDAADAARGVLDGAVAVIITSTVAFVISLVIALLLLKLLFLILNGMLSRIPVLKQINGLFGGIFGLCNGFFWTWMVTNAFVRFLLPTLTEKWPTVFVAEITESVIVQLCMRVNPITYLIQLINFVFH